MISRFMKKNTVFNIGLLIIFLRIYGFIIHLLKKYSENIYIFPKIGENGYPFEEVLQYNLEDINKITGLLIKNNQPNIQPMALSTPSKCTFFGKINMCKSDDFCYDEMNVIKEGRFIYHENKLENNNDNFVKNEHILNLLKEQNKFISEQNVEEELSFYYKIIDGYSSYISILTNDNNLIKRISKSEEKINNLIFLYIIYLKAYISIYKSNAPDINRVLKKNEKYLIEEISSMDKSSIEQLIKILDIKIKDEIINCIPDLDRRNSFLIDFESLLLVIKIIFGIESNNYELKIFDFPFMKLNEALNNLFYLDEQSKKRNFIFSLILKYIGFIYWPISIIIIYYLNQYFIRKKEFYVENKIRSNKLIDEPKYKKLLKYKRNIEMMQKVNKSKYTKEEIDMINKLTKDQKDFIVSK